MKCQRRLNGCWCVMILLVTMAIPFMHSPVFTLNSFLLDGEMGQCQDN